MVVIPILYIFHTILFALLLCYYFQWTSFSIILSSILYIFLFLPFLSIFTIQGTERGIEIFRSLRPLLLCLLPGANTQKLQQTRNELQILLNVRSDTILFYKKEVINEYGPQAFANFEKIRVLKEKWIEKDSGVSKNDVIDDLISWTALDSSDIDHIFFSN